MITYFTTFKNISENYTSIVNSINSWLYSNYKAEVIAFISEDLPNNCNFLRNIKVVKLKNKGLPCINNLFDMAIKHSSNDILCYLNSDIIIEPEFYNMLISIHNNLKDSYLIVGARYDSNVTELIDFNDTSKIKRFLGNKSLKMNVHDPAGSDFFGFPKRQYNSQNLLPLKIGRPKWDNWMIYNGLKKHYKVIDISNAYKVIHQNHTCNYITKASRDINSEFYPSKYFSLFTLTAANYTYTTSYKMLRNSIKKNKILYIKIMFELNGLNIILRINDKLKAILKKIIKNIF